MAKLVNYSAGKYFADDYPHTLFPLATTKVLIENAEPQIIDYIYQHILNKNEQEHSFLSQVRCYASKQGLHLRRTVKLDPVAETFIYDLIFRNRTLFRKEHRSSRQSFGYRFEQGKPLSPSRSYAAFKAAISEARQNFSYCLKFDVAAYFNSIYHHDLIKWFSELHASPEDVDFFGQFLREINGGRSVDCLPQGLHPCKVIGAEFLKFIDNSMKLKSDLLLRFMDDFYLFSNQEDLLMVDFVTVQRLLGEKGLSLNPSKTQDKPDLAKDIAKEIDEIKIQLLQARREVMDTYEGAIFYEFIADSEDIEEVPDWVIPDLEGPKLTPEQTDYLLELLKDPEIEESDAELVLVLLRDHGEDVLSHMNSFLEKFPSLSRNVYNFAPFLTDKEELANVILGFVKKSDNATEDQLFWMGKIAEEYLSETPSYGDILSALYYHKNATTISWAKILEIPEHRFGLPEMREEQLKVGKSDWLAWASAIGTRKETKLSRNHLLKYFGKASSMNHLIADIVINLP
jgi:Reverse transcriptase (RNA-dependent DNA polymerase)